MNPVLPPSVRRTRIVATLGPASGAPETMGELIRAGADVFRLNMSHAPHAWVRETVARVREIAADSGRHTALLLDTQGPAIRTGDVANPLQLTPGDRLELAVRGARGEESHSVDVNYDGLVDDIAEGDTVLVDNGVIRLRVLRKTERTILCEVLTPGSLGSRRHINLPGVRVNLPALTEKDLADVALGAELGVDFVALSFCKEAADIDQLRDVLARHGSRAGVIAKIEDQLAVRNIEGLIGAADAIMIARGDLGIECPMEELPIIQRRVIKRCIRHGKPVIVATHMLESMIQNPLPTRAEITDVANAVFEQADAIMLSGETAAGRYPVECVRVLDRVARRIERSGGAGYAADALVEDTDKKTVRSAVVLANSLVNARLVVFTRRGKMAGFASNLRPDRAPIFAFAPDAEICRRLALLWGVEPVLLPFSDAPGETVLAAERLLREQNLAVAGDHLVIVSDALHAGELVDSIQLRPIT